LTEHDPAARERPAPVHQQMVTGAHLRQGWDALATMLSAMLVFGLPAWWLAEVLAQVWIIPVALVLGMAAAITAIWVRYGVGGP
jgi:predicted benzoate:H+ symporter BenE